MHKQVFFFSVANRHCAERKTSKVYIEYRKSYRLKFKRDMRIYIGLAMLLMGSLLCGVYVCIRSQSKEFGTDFKLVIPLQLQTFLNAGSNRMCDIHTCLSCI